MNSGVDDCIYLYFFIIKISYDRSQSVTLYDSLHFLVDQKCLHRRMTNDEYLLTHWTLLRKPYEEYLEDEISCTELTSRRTRRKRFLCYSVLSVTSETNEPLPRKWTSPSVAIQTYRQSFPDRCLANGHISSQYYDFVEVFVLTYRFNKWS
jgi:hypothetical protein